MRIIVGFWGDPVPRRVSTLVLALVARHPITRWGRRGEGMPDSLPPGLVRQLLAAHTQPSAEWISSD